MKLKKWMMGSLSVMLLAGCAGGHKPDVVKANNGSTLTVSATFAPTDMNGNRYPDTHLREVTTSDANVAKGLAVLGMALGNFSTGSFDKNNYKGTAIKSMPEQTASYFAPRAEAKIKAWLDKQSGSYAYKETLFLSATTWSLIEEENNTSVLSYRVMFYKSPEGGNVFSAFDIAECAPTKVTAPVAEWHANNYQKVTLETQKMMDACLLELDNQLPRLLKKSS